MTETATQGKKKLEAAVNREEDEVEGAEKQEEKEVAKNSRTAAEAVSNVGDEQDRSKQRRVVRRAGARVQGEGQKTRDLLQNEAERGSLRRVAKKE